MSRRLSLHPTEAQGKQLVGRRDRLHSGQGRFAEGRAGSMVHRTG